MDNLVSEQQLPTQQTKNMVDYRMQQVEAMLTRRVVDSFRLPEDLDLLHHHH